MPTRRALLASAALAPLFPAGLRDNERHAESPEATPAPTQVDTPQVSVVPDLTGFAPLPLTGARLAAFVADVAAALSAAAIPGAAIAVVQGGVVVFLAGFGVRQRGRSAPVTADTLLRIGSVTKSFSSLLTATLVDAGRLTWDTPIGDLLPDFAVADPRLSNELTVADAFCACTGLPRRDLEFIFKAGELTPENMISSMRRLPVTAPFGERYQYNNQMVAAGGFAAAVADGGSPDDLGHAFAIALRERVLNPIGMGRSTTDLMAVVNDSDYATPHAEDIAGVLHPLPLLEDDLWLAPVAPAGALWSTAREMARYLQTALDQGVSPDGEQVVTAANLERTWQPAVRFPAVPGATPSLTSSVGYGLGWGVGAYGGQRLLNHSGATLGFSSLVTLLPDADIGLAILTNGTGAAARFTATVQLLLLEELFDQPATAIPQFDSFLHAAGPQRDDVMAQLGRVDPAEVALFLGDYANADLGQLRLGLRAGRLLLTAGGFQSELRPWQDADGTADFYRPVDAPFADGGISPTPMSIGLQGGRGREPWVTLTLQDDDGADLVYRYEPIEPL